MRVSAFTFIKNGSILGYPFVESIKSILEIVDEFVINVGKSEDDTLKKIKSINSPKIKILESEWNENMSNRGYVYGQQKMIAQFNCTGDWAFYIECDEIYHEDDLDKIYNAMQTHKNNSNVEALLMNFIHFYGNANTYVNSPGWYRSEARIIKNNIRSYAPDGLFWLVLEKNKIGRYPKAINIDVNCYHYGWVRNEKSMKLKSEYVSKYWGTSPKKIDYAQIDSKILKKFNGSHPKIIRNWLPKEKGVFNADPKHILSKKERKHRIMLIIERLFKLDLCKKHFKLTKL